MSETLHDSTVPSEDVLLGDVVKNAEFELGVPYVWGGIDGKKREGTAYPADYAPGLDCSGLTQLVYKLARVDIPRTSQEQWAQCKRIQPGAVKPGMLVFFVGADKPSPGHVGIVTEVKNGQCTQMINAPYTGALVSYVKVSEKTALGLVGYGTFEPAVATPEPATLPRDNTVERYSGSCLVGLPLLKAGDNGPAVVSLRMLADTGNGGQLFDTNLHDKVQAYQQSRGLSKDGIVGAETWQALIEDKPVTHGVTA